MQVNVLDAKQMIRMLVIYFCAFLLVTVLIERKIFVLQGVWPAIGILAVRGLVSGLLFIAAMYLIQRYKVRRREQATKALD
jgi:hypothetical protein